MKSSSRTFKAGILGSSKFFVRVASLIAAAVLSRLLSTTDYASYRQTLLVYRFIEPFLALGLTQSLIYFIPRDKENSRSLVTGNIFFLSLMGLLFTIFIWGGGNYWLAERFNNPGIAELLSIYAPYVILALPIASISSCLVSLNRVKALSIYNLAQHLFAFCCVMICVLIAPTAKSAVLGGLVGGVIVAIPGFWLMYRWAEGKVGSFRWGWKIGEQLKFGIPLGISGLVGLLQINLDKILVSSFCTPEQFAIYINGAVEIPMIGIITGSVIAILAPEFSQKLKENQVDETLELWHRAMLKCALLLFPLMFFLMAMASETIVLLFSSKYAESVIPFRIYLLLLPIRITQFGAILIASGKSHLIMIRTLGSLIFNLILSIALIKTLGFIGAAIGTVIVIYAWGMSFNLVAISRLFSLSWSKLLPFRKLGVLLLLTGVVSVPLYILSALFPIASNALRLFLGAVYYFSATLIILLATGFIDRMEIVALASPIIKKIRGRGNDEN